MPGGPAHVGWSLAPPWLRNHANDNQAAQRNGRRRKAHASKLACDACDTRQKAKARVALAGAERLAPQLHTATALRQLELEHASIHHLAPRPLLRHLGDVPGLEALVLRNSDFADLAGTAAMFAASLQRLARLTRLDCHTRAWSPEGVAALQPGLQVRDNQNATCCRLFSVRVSSLYAAAGPAGALAAHLTACF